MLLKRVEIRVTGRVQGVFFRQGTKAEAERLGITGWTRNEPNESVFILAEGEEHKLQKLIEWVKVGTEWTQVEKVDIQWQEATGEFAEFTVR